MLTQNIKEALADFSEEFVLETVEKRLNNDEDPIRIVQELQEGMDLVGKRYSEGKYFLSELILSADLFSQAMKLTEPKLAGRTQETLGKIVIGTPKGDIHDLGKNIFCTVARAAGFKITDLGIDVPVERFIDAVQETKPEILGFSALITPAFETMKQVIDILIEKDVRKNLKIIIGGGVTNSYLKKYLGADGQTTDAVEGLRICKSFVGMQG